KSSVLGGRHYPRGEPAAILADGAWRTPLGDAPIDEGLAAELRGECPLLREDSVAHSTEHSLEVQLPFLQVLAPGFWFVPVALGTVEFESLVSVGEALGRVLSKAKESVWFKSDVVSSSTLSFSAKRKKACCCCPRRI